MSQEEIVRETELLNRKGRRLAFDLADGLAGAVEKLEAHNKACEKHNDDHFPGWRAA